jgi:O-antigen/teichoic acid export membrane protein
MFLLQREFQFRKIGMISVASYVIGYGLIGCTTAFVRKDAWAIVAASISQSLAIAFMLLWTQRKLPRLKFSSVELKDLLTFSSGVTLAQIFANIAYYIDNVIVGRFLGSMALGLYQMAFQIMDLPRRFFGSVVDQVSFVVMSKVQDDQSVPAAGLPAILNIANLILVPITVIMIIHRPRIGGCNPGGQMDRCHSAIANSADAGTDTGNCPGCGSNEHSGWKGIPVGSI